MSKVGNLVLCLAVCIASQVWGDRAAVPLNDYTRLGQRFCPTRPFDGLSVIVPSWLDAEGGLTLTLWDSPVRTRVLGRKAFSNVVDNAGVALRFAETLPAGEYYWEVSDRTGSTRVGLYADSQDANPRACAYFDGKAAPAKRFLFLTTPPATPHETCVRLVRELKAAKTGAARAEAARRLTIAGMPESIPMLAALLSDETLSHAARSVLEAMPLPAAGAALRGKRPELKGKLLVGVINSIGERGDIEAVTPLGELLRCSEPDVAAAAAAALGKIGTGDAGALLMEAVPKAREKRRAALLAGALDCATRLSARGEGGRAFEIFENVRRDAGASPAIRRAATRGAIVNAPSGGATLLADLLRSGDAAGFEVALWVVRRELP